MPVNHFFEPKAVVVHDGVSMGAAEELYTDAEAVTSALLSVSTGTGNSAVGVAAGRNITSGTNNFDLDNSPDRPIDLIHELFGLVKDLHVRDTTWRPEDSVRLTELGNRIKALREKP